MVSLLAFAGGAQHSLESAVGGNVLAPLLGGALAATAVVTAVLAKRRGGASSKRRSSIDLADAGQMGAIKREASACDPRFPNGKLHVWFGSQGGNAEAFAKALAQEAAKYGFQARARDLDDFDPDYMTSSTSCPMVFIVSTYGDGEPPDNARSFAQWIKDKDGLLGPQGLCHMKYAVFGLGNTQYEYYNQFAKDVDGQLPKLGANKYLDLGLGNAFKRAILEEDFERWKGQLWHTLVKRFGNTTTVMASANDEEALPELPFKLTLLPKEDNKGMTVQPRQFQEEEINNSTKHFFDGYSFEAPVAVNRELRSPADGGSTRHIEIDVTGTPGLKYTTADNLAVLPCNSSSSVDNVARAMGYDLDAVLVMEEPTTANAPSPDDDDVDGFKALFPTPCTVRDALTKYIDIMSIPRRSLLPYLARFTQDPNEKARLLHLASQEGREEYLRCVEQEGRSLMELITTCFPSVRIPFDHLINLAPSLQPRYYTISSSSNAHPTSIHITVAVALTSLPEGRVHHGVCSTYLASSVPHSTIRAFVRPSTFRLPKEPSTPIIMIGPGTGIAPMRAMLQDRHVQDGARGDTILFFGCRRRDHDYLYQDELQAFAAGGVLTDLQVAFSRESQGNDKVYVQHLMVQPSNASKLSRLITQGNAHVYVCGATTMGQDVNKALHEVLLPHMPSPQHATQLLKTMQEQGRYVQELWSA